MARRQPDRDSREQIFRAAAAEFAERGYEAAGVDRIADKARVNKAMIYYHFGSKVDLYRAVVQDMMRAVAARARLLADSPDAPDAKMDAWIRTIVEEASARPWFPPILLREFASGITHIDAETYELINAVFAAVRDMIEQGQKAGDFREVDPLLTHLTIMPAIMLFFVREATIAKRPKSAPAVLTSPRTHEEFIKHMQQTVRGMLRKD